MSSGRPRRRAEAGRDVRRTLAVLGAATVIVSLTAAFGHPSQTSERIAPGQPVTFTATAYCDTGTTKAGVRTRSGVAAADPAVLPVGSVVRLHHPEEPRYEGIYTVLDTGSSVQGKRIDLYISSCREAREFGLKRVLVRVLRLGWNPQAIAPSSGRP